jgi:uncharacterized metal-binding protein
MTLRLAAQDTVNPQTEGAGRPFRRADKPNQHWRTEVDTSTPDFSLAVEGVEGLCPAGEVWAKQQIAEKTTPVFACEGPCIRGEIARLAANLVAQEVPGYARACHAETFFVPHSTMARWVKGADRSVMIEGCFLKCHSRVLDNLVNPGTVRTIDVHQIHHKYNDIFLMDDVPGEERKATAREVADKLIQMLTASEQ